MVKLTFVGDLPECTVYPYKFVRGEPVEVDEKLAEKLIADLGEGNFKLEGKSYKKEKVEEPEPEEEPEAPEELEEEE